MLTDDFYRKFFFLEMGNSASSMASDGRRIVEEEMKSHWFLKNGMPIFRWTRLWFWFFHVFYIFHQTSCLYIPLWKFDHYFLLLTHELIQLKNPARLFEKRERFAEKPDGKLSIAIRNDTFYIKIDTFVFKVSLV